MKRDPSVFTVGMLRQFLKHIPNNYTIDIRPCLLYCELRQMLADANMPDDRDFIPEIDPDSRRVVIYLTYS